MVSSCFCPDERLDASLVEDRVVPVGQGAHESRRRTRPSRRRRSPRWWHRACRSRCCRGWSGEHPGVLEHHSEGSAHLVAGEVPVVDAVEQDPAPVDLVEAHQQVDDRGLARSGRPTIATVSPGATSRVKFSMSGWSGVVAEAHVLEPHARGRRRMAEPGSLAGRDPPPRRRGTRRTRSAEAMPDWSMFIWLAIWVIGIVNWREYWMNAVTAPSESSPEATRYPPSTADRDVVDVGR